MKLFEKTEPQLARILKPKNAKRQSGKIQKTLQNRAVRRSLNRDFLLGKEISRRNLGFEY